MAPGQPGVLTPPVAPPRTGAAAARVIIPATLGEQFLWGLHTAVPGAGMIVACPPRSCGPRDTAGGQRFRAAPHKAQGTEMPLPLADRVRVTPPPVRESCRASAAGMGRVLVNHGS